MERLGILQDIGTSFLEKVRREGDMCLVIYSFSPICIPEHCTIKGERMPLDILYY
jgi:hypothetical protein